MFNVGDKVKCVGTFYCGVKDLQGQCGIVIQYDESTYGDGLDYQVSFNDGKQKYWLAEVEMKKASECVNAHAEAQR